MKITDIAPRRHRLSQLYIDGEAAVKVDTETLLRRGIAIGDELDDEELHALNLTARLPEAPWSTWKSWAY